MKILILLVTAMMSFAPMFSAQTQGQRDIALAVAMRNALTGTVSAGSIIAEPQATAGPRMVIAGMALDWTRLLSYTTDQYDISYPVVSASKELVLIFEDVWNSSTPSPNPALAPLALASKIVVDTANHTVKIGPIHTATDRVMTASGENYIPNPDVKLNAQTYKLLMDFFVGLTSVPDDNGGIAGALSKHQVSIFAADGTRLFPR